ncbi:hypothetical protein DL771_004455 [Monosporascus sp. 5C6A]|nr:hypothetical protein DL771_004455 [Monosporascus sp. 5C6A]
MMDMKPPSVNDLAEPSQRTPSSSVALIQRRLRQLKTLTSRKTRSECPDDLRGPLGLTALHEPSEPRVHGLGGGSRKTWSDSEDQSTFWPREWLPAEPGFKHVRIHTYGYNSDWTKRLQSNLTIHDFGQALLADMYNSPQLRKPGDVINDEFRHVCQGLGIWSFFESASTTAGPMSLTIVDKESAIIALLEIADNDVPLPLDDHNMIWTTVFKNRILRTKFSQTQFWVVDALDECSNRNLSTLGQMLSKIDIDIPLRTFFTGRTGGQIERIFSQQNAPILEIRTGSQGSLADIASYVRWRWMPSEEPAVTEQLLAEVLRKSNGIFLWASLILDRLEDAYTLEDMQDIIQQVPSEMDDFYTRIIKSVAASQNAELAKCILKWTTCAARSLSTEELKEAVRADINKTIAVSDDRRDGAVTVFNVKDGCKLDEVPLNRTDDSDSDEGNLVTPGTPPSVVRLSLTHRLAAIAYRNSPITIWDLDRADQVGIFEKEGCEQVYNSPQVIDMVFNPAPQLDLMAVAYKDGDLVTYDPWTLEQHRIYGILVHVLAASPDGRTLATGDSNGVVHLFAFETLRLIYRVAAIEDCVKNIVFASSNIRFFDVRGGCCNVWEPSGLVHREGSDDASSEPQSEELIPVAPATAVTRLFEEGEAITVIEHPPDANFVACGQEDGSISIHELSTGRVTAKLSFHARMVGIRDIKWNPQLGILVSVDDSSRCIATRLALAPSGELQQAQRLFEGRVGKTVLQVLLAPDGSAILLRTIRSSELWKIGHGLTASVETGESSTWVAHPTKEDQLILLQVDTVRVFTWAGLVETTTDGGIPLGATASLSPLASGMWVSRLGFSMIAGVWRLEDQETGFVILEVANISPDTTQLKVAVVRKKLHSHIKVAIGLFRSSLFFLDTRGWICSIGVKAIADVKFYTRHFFVPLAWQTASQLALKVITKNSIAFAHQDQLKIFHGFLDFEEKVYFGGSPDPRRPRMCNS